MSAGAAGRAAAALGEESAPRGLSFQLRPLPPFRLDLTAWVLRRRPENAVDRWDGGMHIVEYTG